MPWPWQLCSEAGVCCVSDKIERTVQIEASTVEIEERGVKLRLTVVDTPGYGDAINCRDWYVHRECLLLCPWTLTPISDLSWGVEVWCVSLKC